MVWGVQGILLTLLCFSLAGPSLGSHCHQLDKDHFLRAFGRPSREGRDVFSGPVESKDAQPFKDGKHLVMCRLLLSSGANQVVPKERLGQKDGPMD